LPGPAPVQSGLPKLEDPSLSDLGIEDKPSSRAPRKQPVPKRTTPGPAPPEFKIPPIVLPSQLPPLPSTLPTSLPPGFPQIPGFPGSTSQPAAPTAPSVYVDFGRGTFAHGQAYVALSRARSLEGMALARNIRQSDIIFDPGALGYRSVFEPLGVGKR
jgi:hypothetical protein